MSGEVAVAYSAGRRNGTSAPYQRATLAIASLSVETTIRSKTPLCRAVSIAYASSGCPARTADVLVRDALRARPALRSARRRSASRLLQERRRGSASGLRAACPRATTEPVIASSSVGRPARASRAVDVVRSLGQGLDDRPLVGRVDRDAVGRRHRARLVDRRAESRPPGSGRRGARPRREPEAAVGRGQRREPGDLLPEHARARSSRRDARARQREAGRAQRSSVSTETTSEAAVIVGAPGASLDDDPRLRRVRLDPPDRARDDGRRRRPQQARAGADSLDVLEPVQEREDDGARERAGIDALERVARGRAP